MLKYKLKSWFSLSYGWALFLKQELYSYLPIFYTNIHSGYRTFWQFSMPALYSKKTIGQELPQPARHRQAESVILLWPPIWPQNKMQAQVVTRLSHICNANMMNHSASKSRRQFSKTERHHGIQRFKSHNKKQNELCPVRGMFSLKLLILQNLKWIPWRLWPDFHGDQTQRHSRRRRLRRKSWDFPMLGWRRLKSWGVPLLVVTSRGHQLKLLLCYCTVNKLVWRMRHLRLC